MRKKLFYIFLVLSPVIFFSINRLTQFIFGNDNSGSLKAEIISAVIVGYFWSYGMWTLNRKLMKKKEAEEKEVNKITN